MATLLFLCLLIAGFLLAACVGVALFFAALFLIFDSPIERAQKRNLKQNQHGTP